MIRQPCLTLKYTVNRWGEKSVSDSYSFYSDPDQALINPKMDPYRYPRTENAAAAVRVTGSGWVSSVQGRAELTAASSSSWRRAGRRPQMVGWRSRSEVLPTIWWAKVADTFLGRRGSMRSNQRRTTMFSRVGDISSSSTRGSLLRKRRSSPCLRRLSLTAAWSSI